MTTARTYEELHSAGAKGERYFAPWHVDNSGSDGSHNFHWMYLMVAKEGDEVAASSIGRLPALAVLLAE